MTSFKKARIMSAIALVISISLTITPFFVKGNNDSLISWLSFYLTAIGTIITVVTFIVALMLYDRFSLDSKIIEKQSESVIELLLFLKGRTFYASVNNFNYILRPSVKHIIQLKKTPRFQNDASKIIIVSKPDYEYFNKNLKTISRNNWLPSEIRAKLNFLEIYGTINGTFSIEDFVRLDFGYELDKEWCGTMPEIRLCDFTNNLLSLIKETESWIKSRSSISIRLVAR